MMSKERELLQRILDTDPKFLGGRFIGEIQELLAQPEQEPVAWHYIYDDGITVRERVTECMPLGEHYTVTPLYKALPKREPLSDGEINAYLSLIEPPFLWDEGFCSGIEWAEKQHGIGVDDD